MNSSQGLRRSAWRRRRLHFEHLERREAPGAFVIGPTLLGISGGGVNEAISAAALEKPDSGCGQLDQAAQRLGTTWPSLAETRTSDPADLLNISGGAQPSFRIETVPGSSAGGSFQSAVSAATPSSALLSDLFAAAPQFQSPTAADAPILHSSTLPDLQSKPVFISDGGGGGNSGGGAAGCSGAGGGASHDGATNASAGSLAAGSGVSASASNGAVATPVAPNASASQCSAWSVPTGIGQCRPKADSPQATHDNSLADGLKLVDASGNALNITLNANTLVIGAATWCGNTAKLKTQLATPEAQAALSGLRMIWAFGDEGGTGPGGVLHADFLQGIPGEVAFLGAGSFAPDKFPTAFNAATGQFDTHPLDVISAWLSGTRGSAAPSVVPESPSVVPESPSVVRGSPDPAPTATEGLKLTDAAGAPLSLALDNNTLVIAAATWCPHCADLEMALSQPETQSALDGLHIVFAFGNEGGSGPGGVVNPEVLSKLPGDAAFLAPGSVQASAFPTAFDPATGEFSADPYAAITAWHNSVVRGSPDPAQAVDRRSPDSPSLETSGQASGSVGRPATTDDVSGGGNGSALAWDYNSNSTVDAADYVMWRKTVGATGPNLPADGNNDQKVDSLDYDQWQMHFGEMLTVPGPFTITGPNGTQTQSQVTVTWSASAGATSYHFVLSNNPDLSSPINDQTVTTTSVDLNLPTGDYYAGVTAINSDGMTVASNQAHFFNVLLPLDQVLFVTSGSFSIDTNHNYPPLATSFGSVQAADYQCTNIASNAGLLDAPWDFSTIIFRAIVTQATTDVVTRASMGNNKYYNTAGQLIANDLNDLLDGNFPAPILTQTGSALTGAQAVWTGALANGNASSNNCVNWSSHSGLANAGNVNGTGTNWLFQASVSCVQQGHLYCVGKKKSS